MTSENIREKLEMCESAEKRNTADYVTPHNIMNIMKREEDDLPKIEKNESKKKLESKIKNMRSRKAAESTSKPKNDAQARKMTEFWAPKPEASRIPAKKPLNIEPKTAKTGFSALEMGPLPTKHSGDSENIGHSEILSGTTPQPTKGISNSGI